MHLVQMFLKYLVTWPTNSSLPFIRPISRIRTSLKCFRVRAVRRPLHKMPYYHTMVLITTTSRPGILFRYQQPVPLKEGSIICYWHKPLHFGSTCVPVHRWVIFPWQKIHLSPQRKQLVGAERLLVLL